MNNRGKNWTRGDERMLLSLLSDGKTLENAASVLRRSLPAIKHRLRLIVSKNVDDEDETQKLRDINNSFLNDTIEQRVGYLGSNEKRDEALKIFKLEDKIYTIEQDLVIIKRKLLELKMRVYDNEDDFCMI